jgi:hypothetical protein
LDPKTIGEVTGKCNIDSILDKIIILTMTPNVRKTNMIDKYINIDRETLLVMIGFLGSISLLVSLVIRP